MISRDKPNSSRDKLAAQLNTPFITSMVAEKGKMAARQSVTKYRAKKSVVRYLKRMAQVFKPLLGITMGDFGSEVAVKALTGTRVYALSRPLNQSLKP